MALLSCKNFFVLLCAFNDQDDLNKKQQKWHKQPTVEFLKRYIELILLNVCFIFGKSMEKKIVEKNHVLFVNQDIVYIQKLDNYIQKLHK